jgi:hypothetical protein
MPPALRNQRTPTAGDTPASTAASSLERPEAIATQNCLQFSRCTSRGRNGGRKAAPTHRSEPRLYLFIATSFAEVLRRPVESALYFSIARTGDDVARVTLFEAAMGPQIGGAIVAIQHDLNPPLVSLMVGVGITLSFITLPLWSQLLHQL